MPPSHDVEAELAFARKLVPIGAPQSVVRQVAFMRAHGLYVTLVEYNATTDKYVASGRISSHRPECFLRNQHTFEAPL